MILGNVCTRRCGFCAVQKGAPSEVDYDEPRRVADAVAAMGLRYAVVTSVNRDDRRDGGSRRESRRRPEGEQAPREEEQKKVTHNNRDMTPQTLQ